MLSFFGIVPKDSFLDLPNAALGTVFYLQHIIFNGRIKVLILPAMASSLFLAHRLTFVVRDLCLLCWSTHAINFALFWHEIFAPFTGFKTKGERQVEQWKKEIEEKKNEKKKITRKKKD